MKKLDAYFTVEASMVMPMVIAAVLLVVYLLFFQYDRCLMEQNTGRLALRGCTGDFADGEELVQELMIQAGKEDARFLAWEMEKADIVYKNYTVSVKREGMLRFPFRGLIFWGGDTAWSCGCQYENNRVTPTLFIRNCRKIMGGK